MKIAVFGLGYVGCVSAACLAKEGHDVVGVDVSDVKVDMINRGQCPIVEKDLDGILSMVTSGKAKGSLRATKDAARAVEESDISLICVGTPSEDNGSLRLDFIRRCATDIGRGLKNHKGYHVVVARSTMLPGSVEQVIVPEVEYASGKRAGRDFGVAINPEFLRESTSIQDFYNPPVTVIGALDARSGETVAKVYDFLSAPVELTDVRTAEMVKYACNTFHALKVAFGNEIGTLCKGMKIDSHRVMEIFCLDTKLNLSSYYLKPGFAFGGSCLPKDLRALTYRARELDLDLPLLGSIVRSNEVHIDRALRRIVQSGHKKVGVLGLSFKAGTDDLRESPLVTLVESLIGKGFDVRIYDRSVSIARLVGANKEYIERGIPHISSLMSERLADVVAHGDVLVIGNKDEEFTSVARSSDAASKLVLDLVRVSKDIGGLASGYEGVCW